MYLMTFTVEGTGPFPLDMLRYDTCWPTDQQSVLGIAAPFRGDESVRRVRLTKVGNSRAECANVAEDRWRSFRWTVVGTESLRRA